MTLTVHLAPDGNDAASGMTPAEPVRTLERAQQVIEDAAGGPNTPLGEPVEVRIAPRTAAGDATPYPCEDFRWRYYDERNTTSLIPAGWADGWAGPEVTAAGGRPVFDGGWRLGYGLHVEPGRDSATKRTNLVLRYLTFKRFVTGGVHIGGGTEFVPAGEGITVRVPTARTADANVFHGLMLTDLGDLDAPEPAAPGYGYAGLGLSNSSDNIIRDCHFLRLRNYNLLPPSPDEGDLIHAFYLAHGASRNTAWNCRIDAVSGDPLRVRNKSSDNTWLRLNITGSGAYGPLSDYYRTPANYPTTAEYRSWRNRLLSSTVTDPYPGADSRYCERGFLFDAPTACPPPPDRILVALGRRP